MVDDLVRKALAKWPNVPAIAGWLRLTAQGNWQLTGPEATGLEITNERILNFIARNYDHDDIGRFFFQNGPQKVYVSLEVDPWVFRLLPVAEGRMALVSHTGLCTIPQRILMDDLGRVHFITPLGLGLLHSSDMALFSNGVSEAGSQLVHQVVWEVPDSQQLAGMPVQKVKLRAATGAPVQVRDVTFALEQVDAKVLSKKYRFVPNPKVEQ